MSNAMGLQMAAAAGAGATAGLAVALDALVPQLLAAIRPAETVVVQQSPKRKRRRTGEGEAGEAAPVGPRN